MRLAALSLMSILLVACGGGSSPEKERLISGTAVVGAFSAAGIPLAHFGNFMGVDTYLNADATRRSGVADLTIDIWPSVKVAHREALATPGHTSGTRLFARVANVLIVVDSSASDSLTRRVRRALAELRHKE